MSDPVLGLLMLGLIVVVIMLGFPTAFTLMGLGMFFGFVAFYDPSQTWADNRIFDLMVQRTYGAMTNDTLLSIPLFVLMGYIMERGALVDKMFYSIQLAFRRLPASLAVATLVVCTFWGIASGLVGAVVVLMGVIAMRPMLNAGYDVRLASGVITAGGTLGILIPPSVMIIVYAAVAGQSVVKLYAAAMFPGFFLSFLYLVYIVGWALINPKVAPKLPEEQLHVPAPAWTRRFESAFSRRMLPSLIAGVFLPGRVVGGEGEARVTYPMILKNLGAALLPLLLVLATFYSVWWYVVIHSQADVEAAAQVKIAAKSSVKAPAGLPAAEEASAAKEPEGLQELGKDEAGETDTSEAKEAEGLQELGETAAELGAKELEAEAAAGIAPPGEGAASQGVPEAFYTWFWWCLAAGIALVMVYYWYMDGEQLQILKLLSTSILPLGILTFVVLAVILFGITTATESAAVGAAGAFIMALHARTLTFQRMKEAVFLTAKTTAMVCWLFVGSALFSAVFAILGGQQLVEQWVLSLNMTPIQFMILSQAIIFVLGWPLEWTEIIVIFVPIFLPLLQHFHIDPILWGTLVFVNLQAAFLSPPVAMSAFYLKGVSPPHVTLNQIFAGMMPYMLVVIVCMVIMYFWPGLTLWLPNYLYGGG